MSKKCYRFFGGLLNAQAKWLNKMSEKGYRLVRTGRVLYEFEECSPDEVTYCVHPSGSCTVRGAGVFCTAYFQSDAGSCRSPRPDRQLCAHLRQRHLLYCSL